MNSERVSDYRSSFFLPYVIFIFGLFHIFSAFFIAFVKANPPGDFVSYYYTSEALLKVDPKVLYAFSIENGQPVLNEEIITLAEKIGCAKPLDLPAPYNPSYLVAYMLPFLQFPPNVAGKLHTIFNLIVLILTVFLFSRELEEKAFFIVAGIIFLSYPVKISLIFGQSQLLLLLLVVLIFTFWNNQPIAGIILGLTLLHKPFTFLIFLFAILKKRWKLALWSLAVVTIFLGLDVLIWGKSILKVYLEYIGARALLIPNWVGSQSFLSILSGNNSYRGELSLVSQNLKIFFYIFFSLVSLLSLSLVIKRRRGKAVDLNLLIVSGVLSSPVLYPQHFMTVFPAFILFEREKMSVPIKLLGAIGMTLMILPSRKEAPTIFNATHLYLGLFLLWSALIGTYLNPKVRPDP